MILGRRKRKGGTVCYGTVIISIILMGIELIQADTLDDDEANFPSKFWKSAQPEVATLDKPSSKILPQSLRCTCSQQSSSSAPPRRLLEEVENFEVVDQEEEQGGAASMSKFERPPDMRSMEMRPILHPNSSADTSKDSKDAQQRVDLIELERHEEEMLLAEDCPTCRALDCDIIFALLFTVVIGCLLVMIMFFWLRGVFQYKECAFIITLIFIRVQD
ncbi:hypothetical protein DdX_15551 [Ditylenchus destructor]|uniref:Uncharacterized protein n=1 Tax=Ditylenchus destructor TaxID=166010 RepID=A0AAD4R0S1_9BILA|nr:hypothetical protein DdX_15551 [Ditylenchus destructor]